MRVDADITRLALKLAPLVCVRPGELRQAQWADVDLENAQWRIRPTHEWPATIRTARGHTGRRHGTGWLDPQTCLHRWFAEHPATPNQVRYDQRVYQ